MTRLLGALLLFSLTAMLSSQVEPPSLIGQPKKEKMKKKKKDVVPPGELKEDVSRVLPVFDPGSHTQPISAMGFTTDNKKLVTVGQDFTVQVWSTATGERLDILRLPGYGREKGYDAGRWDVAAVSPDGTRVALGGEVKLLSPDGDDRTGRLVLVDVVKRTVHRVQIRTGLNRPVRALAFSPDGETLAMVIEKGPKEGPELILVGDLKTRIKNANPLIRTNDCKQVSLTNNATELAFSPDGKRLAIGAKKNKSFSLWDVPAGATPEPKLVKNLAFDMDLGTLGIAWSPDGKRFIHSIKDNGEDGKIRGFDLRTADGDLVKSWRKDDLVPALTPKAFVTLFGVWFLDSNMIYFVANGGTSDPAVGGGTIAGILDLATGKSRRLGIHIDGMVTVPTGAASTDGKLVAYTLTGNTEAMVGPADGTAFVRCGQRIPAPYYLGWSKDPAKPGFAWTAERTRAKIFERDPSVLQFGFDLKRVEPVGAIDGVNYDTARWTHADWSLKVDGNPKKAPNDGFKGHLRLVQAGKPVAGLPGVNSSARTLIPAGGGSPLIALSIHLQYMGERAYIHKADGTMLTRLLPDANNVTDLVSSPDGRFLAATTGTPRINVYRTDGSTYPLFSFAQLNGEWVIWTPEGYYAASPGGEKMFGWAINNGPNALVSFHPAEKYAKKFRRPDIIKLMIEKGSLAAALTALDTEQEDLDDIVPPKAELKLLKQDGAKVVLKAEASSGSKDKPVQTMRLLLDGRPLPEGRGRYTVPKEKPAETEWEVQIPGGSHELKMLVMTDEGSTVSDPVVVVAPKSPDKQPTLHRLFVGVNDYDDPGLKLNAAVKDAEEVFAAFQQHCIGSHNRFGTATGELLLNKQATREAVLKAFKKIRKDAKPGDLVVFFFAGHGVREDKEYYLLTKEADTSKKSLKDISLSGEDLREALSDIECPVLLILDACHSAKGLSARPLTDFMTRDLTHEKVGVTIMAAAMAHEVANANAENGYFTAGLLKALKMEAGVPFDPYERALYTHHIYSVVFSEVRKASNGKQNPFLNSAWTAPPLVVREIPK